MAQSFHSLGYFHKCAEARHPQHLPMHRVVYVMLLEECLPRIGLQLFDAQRQTFLAGIDGQNHRLHHRPLAQNLTRMLDPLRP